MFCNLLRPKWLWEYLSHVNGAMHRRFHELQLETKDWLCYNQNNKLEFEKQEVCKMNDLYNSLARIFGPLVQIIIFFFTVFLAVWCICAVAYWGEWKLIRTKNLIWRILPFPPLVIGMLYGGMRFSGRLLYSTDGWDQCGHWNYTNQNHGVYILFICGCMLIGAILAIHKEKIFLKG